MNVLATTPLWVVNSRMKMQGAKMRRVGPAADDESNKGHPAHAPPAYEEVQLKYKNIVRKFLQAKNSCFLFYFDVRLMKK